MDGCVTCMISFDPGSTVSSATDCALLDRAEFALRESVPYVENRVIDRPFPFV